MGILKNGNFEKLGILKKWEFWKKGNFGKMEILEKKNPFLRFFTRFRFLQKENVDFFGCKNQNETQKSGGKIQIKKNIYI